MSNNIGKKQIKIPSDFKITILQFSNYNTLLITSPSLLTQQFSFPSYFHLSVVNDFLSVSTNTFTSESKALWGSLRSLIQSAFIGLSSGFTRKLFLKGVGYRFQPTDRSNVFLLYIGFTLPVTITIPAAIECKLINNTTLEGKCNNLQLLTNTFNNIRIIKASNKDRYKNKGIMISN